MTKKASLADRAYRRTPKGFLVRSYSNISRRCKRQAGYIGLPVCTREEFYKFGLDSEVFRELFNAWLDSGCSTKLTPSVDRRDTSKGYTLDNIRWTTHSENSKRKPGKIPLFSIKLELTKY